MKTFISAWIIAAVIILAINMDHRGETTTFYGIAESQEIIVNSEHPVEIRRIYVLPGQRVSKGDLLAEFYRSDINFQVNEITHRMRQIEAENDLLQEEISSRINQLELQKRSIVNQYSSQINELEAQYRLNRLLSSELKSIQPPDTIRSNAANPLAIRIENLKSEMRYALDPVNIEIKLLRSQLRAGRNPSLRELEMLKNKLSLIQDEKILLNVVSPIDGVIGSVNFKEGEMVSEFSPIITISAASPSYIKGYVHENVYSRVGLTDEVEIASIADSRNRVIGVVSGVGSRIVDFPERLRRTPDLLIWGREVTISIPENSPFLLGEKVVIKTSGNKNGLFSALRGNRFSSEALADGLGGSVSDEIKISGTDKDENLIEASGVVYIKNLNSYLIVSDESKTPHAIKMNSSGIIEEFLPITGVGRVNDMEEITAIDDSTFIITCSQSFNRRGELRDERKLLLKTVLRNDEFVVKDSILLYDFLYNQARANSSKPWAQFLMLDIQNGMPSINIEAVAFVGDTMLLGFKSPHIEKENSVVLYVANYQNMFTARNSDIAIGIRNSFVLRDGRTRSRYGISGFYIKNDTLYITATSFNNNTAGGIWTMSLSENSPKNIKVYDNRRPEGISFDHGRNSLVVVHDMGGDVGSYMTFLK